MHLLNINNDDFDNDDDDSDEFNAHSMDIKTFFGFLFSITPLLCLICQVWRLEPVLGFDQTPLIWSSSKMCGESKSLLKCTN